MDVGIVQETAPCVELERYSKTLRSRDGKLIQQGRHERANTETNLIGVIETEVDHHVPRLNTEDDQVMIGRLNTQQATLSIEEEHHPGAINLCPFDSMQDGESHYAYNTRETDRPLVVVIEELSFDDAFSEKEKNKDLSVASVAVIEINDICCIDAPSNEFIMTPENFSKSAMACQKITMPNDDFTIGSGIHTTDENANNIDDEIDDEDVNIGELSSDCSSLNIDANFAAACLQKDLH